MARPRRIHIVGGPGSGKTTLARRLGAALQLPVHHLDAVYEAGSGDVDARLPGRLATVHAIATGPAWVTEGIYLWFTRELFDSADLVIWLDPPWRVATYRIVKRHMLASLAGTNRYPGIRRLWRFLGYTREYWYGLPPAGGEAKQDDRRSVAIPYLAPYRSKVEHCRGSADCRRIVRRLVRGDRSARRG